MKDRYIKKIALFNAIHMLFSFVFFIFALLFLASWLSRDFLVDKTLNIIILVLSGVAMGVIKVKVTHLKHQRYHYLTHHEDVPEFEEE